MTEKDSYIYFDKDTDFTGEIESSRVVLEGRIKGVVRARKQVHLKEGAYIEGEIYAGHLVADEGSSCFGELRVNNKNSAWDKPDTETGNGSGESEKNVLMRVASSLTVL